MPTVWVVNTVKFIWILYYSSLSIIVPMSLMVIKKFMITSHRIYAPICPLLLLFLRPLSLWVCYFFNIMEKLLLWSADCSFMCVWHFRFIFLFSSSIQCALFQCPPPSNKFKFIVHVGMLMYTNIMVIMYVHTQYTVNTVNKHYSDKNLEQHNKNTIVM